MGRPRRTTPARARPQEFPMQRLHAFLLATVVLATALFGTALPAAAQTGRVTGVILDNQGKGIRGATLRAENPTAYPAELTTTTDDKGRFALIGLRAGIWKFTAEAPGFEPGSGSAPIRAATVGAPLRFVLVPIPVPIPGALSNDIARDLADADQLRAQGRFDQAATAYEAIRAKNPKFTAVNLSLAAAYRERALREGDAAAKRTLLERAIARYTDLLEAGDAAPRARLELGSTQIEAGLADEGARTLQALVTAAPESTIGREAAARLAAARR